MEVNETEVGEDLVQGAGMIDTHVVVTWLVKSFLTRDTLHVHRQDGALAQVAHLRQHRVLLFSHFVDMLEILVRYCEQESIEYCYIDGV